MTGFLFVFSASDALKMATQTKLQNSFGKCRLPATKQVQKTVTFSQTYEGKRK